MYKAILFDLDGTLLHMSNDDFIGTYLKELSKRWIKLGVAPEDMVSALWYGTGFMRVNDGSCKNRDAFWKGFISKIGGDAEYYDRETVDFYVNEFNRVKAVAKENPLACRAVELAHRNGRKVVLATNPVFPRSGQLTRVSWLGLSESDFDLITDYENDSYCKPNKDYYLSIAQRIGVRPEECLMVGNDETEDMMAAEAAGMDGFLVTDYLIPAEDYSWQGKRGSSAELVEFLESL